MPGIRPIAAWKRTIIRPIFNFKIRTQGTIGHIVAITRGLRFKPTNYVMLCDKIFCDIKIM